MIDARTFAKTFSSIWASLTPQSAAVIRRINLMVERFYDPLPSIIDPHRIAIVNEVGFHMALLGSLGLDTSIEEATKMARTKLIVLDRVGDEELKDLNQIESQQSMKIEDRLNQFFRHEYIGKPQYSPVFKGVGYIDQSEADIVANDCLWEVKGGQRSFRAIDLRQLLIYSSMKFSEDGIGFSKIGLLNPRMGTYYFADLDSICFELGGVSKEELFRELIHLTASGDLSR